MSQAVFPVLPGLKWDVLKAPAWSTKIQQSVGGKEVRAQFFSRPLYTWTLVYELLRASVQLELQTLIGFFNARQGKYDSFLFSDPSDNTVTAMGFGVGDGATTAFQIQRTAAGPRTLDWQGVLPVYTTQRTNYLPFSEQLSSWTGTATITPAAAVCGSAVLDLVYDPAGGESNYQTEDVTLLSPGTKGLSLLVKKGLQPPAQSQVNLFDLTASAFRLQAVISFDVAGVPSVSMNFGTLLGIDAEANGCYRLRLQSAATIGGNVHRTYLQPSKIGSLAGDCYFGAVQLEDTAPTGYIKTGAAQVTAVPAYWPLAGDAFEPVLDVASAPIVYRQDWQGNQQMYPTLRRNGTLWSEQLDNAGWTKTNATVTANAANGPDGNLVGDQVAATATGAVFVFQTADAVTAGRKCTISRDFKPGTAAFVWAGDQADSIWHRAWVNCSTMTISTLDGADLGATLTQLLNGWWRLTVSFTRTNAGTLSPTVGISDVTNSTSSTAGKFAYFAGAQSELSPFATSYIGPTTGAAVTRTDYTLSATGLVTFAVAPLAAQNGQVPASLTWTGSFFWRVRFDLDQAEFNNFLSQLWEAKKITLTSVK